MRGGNCLRGCVYLLAHFLSPEFKMSKRKCSRYSAAYCVLIPKLTDPVGPSTRRPHYAFWDGRTHAFPRCREDNTTLVWFPSFLLCVTLMATLYFVKLFSKGEVILSVNFISGHYPGISKHLVQPCIFQVRRLRLGDTKEPAQGHTAHRMGTLLPPFSLLHWAFITFSGINSPIF